MTETLTPTTFGGLRLMKARDRIFSFNMMLYGDAGVGKTHLAGSADAVPEMRRVLYLDVESGSNTLKRAWPNVDLVEINTWGDLTNVYDSLFAGGHDYRTVVIDSLTELNDYCIDYAAEEAKAKREGFDGVLEWKDWNKVSSRMLRMIRLFRDLPMSTVFVAHMQEKQDERTRRVTKVPLVTGKLAFKVPTIPDIVLHMFVEEVEGEQKRLLQTTKTATCVAKARGVVFPPILGLEKEVDMQLLYDYIQASKENA